MSVVLDEPLASACIAALSIDDQILISAVTVTECLIVAGRRGLAEGMERLIDQLGVEIVGVTPAFAYEVGRTYSRWGKGVHRAALNMGDCFAYTLAKERGCPLLYIGKDFAQTDLTSVLPLTTIRPSPA